MKIRSTTPNIKQIATSSTLVAAAVVMVLSSPMGVYADRFDDQIKNLESEVAQYETQINGLNNRANTLSSAVDALQAKQNKIQAEINLNETKQQKIARDIKANQKKMDNQQAVLGDTLADMYVGATVSPIEMLASSNNIGDYLDQAEYQSSIRDNLQDSIEQIQKLKAKLAKQKTDVENILAEQEGQRAQLIAAKNEQATLLQQTRGEQSAYSELVADRRAQMNQIRDEQQAAYAAARAAWSGGYISAGGSGNYPWAGQGLSLGCSGSCVDSWNLYVGQCVSYVAWKLDSQGYKVYGFDGMGNAAEWPSTTTDYWGSKYGSGNAAKIRYEAKAGYAAVDPNIAAPYGHVMYVESVNGDGTINVSEYNFRSADVYSERRISPNGLTFLEFARK